MRARATRWHLLVCTMVLAMLPTIVQAASKEVINQKIEETLSTFRSESPEAAKLVDKAKGVLVFPDVVEMGFGIGGEYGEGGLLIDGEPQAYYSTAGASFGLQLGAQTKAVMILFMNDRELRKFQRSRGWEAGVDGSVTVATVEVGGGVDSRTLKEPIIGFVFSNRGLMYNLSLEGNKITKLRR